MHSSFVKGKKEENPKPFWPDNWLLLCSAQLSSVGLGLSGINLYYHETTNDNDIPERNRVSKWNAMMINSGVRNEDINKYTANKA